MARYTIRLAKGDFKFSAAHFTLFAGGEAELLHGHNYRVRVELEGEALDAHGLLVPFDGIKAAIRSSCRALDGRVLIPAAAERLLVRREADAVAIEFDGRSYRLPAADVVELPLRNTSIELLAEWLWRELRAVAAGSGAREMAVEVEETDGQSCRFSAPLGA